MFTWKTQQAWRPETQKRQRADAGKKNLSDIWALFVQMAQNKTNLTLVTDSTHFLPLNICDINAISLYGELTQLKAETKKLEAEKVKIEALLKEYATKTWKQTNYLKGLEQWFSTFLHQRTSKQGKNNLRTGNTIAMNGPDYHNIFVNQSYGFISRILIFRK